MLAPPGRLQVVKAELALGEVHAHRAREARPGERSLQPVRRLQHHLIELAQRLGQHQAFGVSPVIGLTICCTWDGTLASPTGGGCACAEPWPLGPPIACCVWATRLSCICCAIACRWSGGSS